MNKKFESIVKRYYMSRNWSIACVYKKASNEKWRAESDIIEEMNKMGGYGYRIIAHNSNTFSCGYLFTDSAGELWLMYHTAYNRYTIKIYQ